MSAKNRGTVSKPYDFYQTPEYVIRRFLDNYPLKYTYYNALEPCAGNGAISKVLKEKYPLFELDQVEIRSEEKEVLSQYGNVYIGDFLTWKTDKVYDVIITNPPYSLAQQFIEKCFELSHENTEIIMLLRLGFLGSVKRFNFWKKYPVKQLYILSKRPSFTGKGTDASEYAWFVWNNKNKDIKVI